MDDDFIPFVRRMQCKRCKALKPAPHKPFEHLPTCRYYQGPNKLHVPKRRKPLSPLL